MYVMNIFETIKLKMTDFTKSEQKIAAYCMVNLKEFAFDSLENVSESIGTSTASVVRFCKKLGFFGYKEFQDDVRKGFKYQPDLPKKLQRTIGSESENTIEKNILCINNTFEQIQNANITDAVSLVSGAKRVFTFGMKESYSLAHYAYTRFLTVRKDVYILSAGFNGEVEPVLSLTPDDVCIVFLFHRYTRQTLQILPLIKETGAKIILVTSPPYGEVSTYASVLLPTYTDAGGIKNTYVAPICLVDCLCNALAVANGKEALEHMQKSEELFKKMSVLGS